MSEQDKCSICGKGLYAMSICPQCSIEGYGTAGERVRQLERELTEAQAENEKLRGVLAEIAKGEGRFSLDPLTHAANTIEDMKNLAAHALKGGA